MPAQLESPEAVAVDEESRRRLIKLCELLVRLLSRYAPFFPLCYELLADLAPLHREIAQVPWRELLQQYPDESLAILVQRRGESWKDAFEVLWEVHGAKRWVFDQLRRGAGANSDVAEEVTSIAEMEIYIALYLHRKFNPDIATLRAYLGALARNSYRNWLAKEGKEPKAVDPGLRLEELTSEQGAGQARSDWLVSSTGGGTLDRVHDAISCLPTPQREVLELSLEGRADDAIATELGISKQAVYRARWRAIKRIKDQFEREHWVETHGNHLFQPQNPTGGRRSIVAELGLVLPSNQATAVEYKTPERLYAEVAEDLECPAQDLWERFFRGAWALMEAWDNLEWLKNHRDCLARPDAALSRLERQVLQDAVNGRPADETARQLGIPERKVVRVRNKTIKRLRERYDSEV